MKKEKYRTGVFPGSPNHQAVQNNRLCQRPGNATYLWTPSTKQCRPAWCQSKRNQAIPTTRHSIVAYYLVRAGIVRWLLLGDSYSGCWVAEVQKHGNSFMGQSREPQRDNCDQDRFYNYWVELKGSPLSQAKSLRGIAFLKWIWWELGFFLNSSFLSKNR